MTIYRLRQFLVGFLLLGIVLMTSVLIFGSQASGISSDEQIHMLDFRGLRWVSDPNQAHFGSYGLSFQLIAHGLAVLLGIEPLNQLSVSPAGFAVRHFVSAAMTVGTSVVVGLIVWVMGRKRLLALWASLATLCVPPLLGHGFFNPKDIPVAFGYSVVTLLSVFYLYVAWRQIQPSRVQNVLLGGGAVLGVWILVGVRFGMLYLLLLTIFVTLLLLYWLLRKSKKDYRKKVFFWFLSPFFVGLTLVALTNPCIVSRTSDDCRWGWQLIPRIFGGAADFSWPFQTFLAGQLVAGVDPPFWYLPVALWAGFPLLLGVLALAGAVFYVEYGSTDEGRGVRWNLGSISWPRLAILIPVALQALAGPSAAVLLRATIYDSQRQHLYVYPALVVLGALGLLALTNLMSRILKPAVAAVVSLCIGALILIFPAYESIRLFPYTYVYVNPLASVNGFAKHWETDYWATSLREALTVIPEGANIEIPVQFWTVTPYLPESRAGGQTNTSTEKYVIQMHRVGTGFGEAPAECQLVHTVSRNLRGEDLPMSYVSKCDIDIDVGSMPYYEIAQQGPYLSK